MGNGILVATGWCSQGVKQEKYPHRSEKTFQKDWLVKYWQPYIERYIVPDQYFYLFSHCKMTALFDPKNANWLQSPIPNEMIDHRWDFHCSLMLSAQFALCYGYDWIFIEQDCMVKGLDRALEWARDAGGLIYGYGANCSLNAGWAEQSFMFCSNDFLHEFIYQMNYPLFKDGDVELRLHETRKGIPEPLWHHEMFGKIMTPWPFGYGRLRPKNLDWNAEVFYLQQVSDGEIERLMGGG